MDREHHHRFFRADAELEGEPVAALEAPGRIRPIHAWQVGRDPGADVVSKRTVEVSLMPAGLLDTLSNAEIADLLAYLGALTEPKPK